MIGRSGVGAGNVHRSRALDRSAEVTRDFVDSLRRSAFLAGAELRSENRALSSDEIRRAVEPTFDERRAELRQQVAEEVRALAELEIAPLPPSVLDEYEALNEEAPASLPFFSETFLYPLVGKEDARVLLAHFEEPCEAAGVLDPSLEDPEIEEMANRLRAGCADACLAGVLFAEREPNANWTDYGREARNRYPSMSRSGRTRMPSSSRRPSRTDFLRGRRGAAVPGAARGGQGLAVHAPGRVWCDVSRRRVFHVSCP